MVRALLHVKGTPDDAAPSAGAWENFLKAEVGFDASRTNYLPSAEDFDPFRPSEPPACEFFADDDYPEPFLFDDDEDDDAEALRESQVDPESFYGSEGTDEVMTEALRETPVDPSDDDAPRKLPEPPSCYLSDKEKAVQSFHDRPSLGF